MRDNHAAIEAVRQAMTQGDGNGGWSAMALADRAGVSANTVRLFLSGRSWPIMATLGKLERALGWPAGRIEDIALGRFPTAAVSGAVTNGHGSPVAALDGAAADPDRPDPVTFTIGNLTIAVWPRPGFTEADVEREAADVFAAIMRTQAERRRQREE